VEPVDRAIHRSGVVVDGAPAVEGGLWWIGVTIVATMKQGFGDNFDMAGHLSGQLTELSTVQFAQRWLLTP